jgi:hypothetical protein
MRLLTRKRAGNSSVAHLNRRINPAFLRYVALWQHMPFHGETRPPQHKLAKPESGGIFDHQSRLARNIVAAVTENGSQARKAVVPFFRRQRVII